MEEIIKNACGVDVHKKEIVATIMCEKTKQETMSYGTTTKELSEFSKWLSSNNITHVAMESTGPYWKPVYNILEDDFKIILGNARHIKNVPGRKTDVKDSQWICKLLKNGLIQSSLILPKNFRGLKDLSRYRRKLVQTKTAEKNRILKILEDANIKLSNVICDVFGKTGRSILNFLLLDKKTQLPKLHRKLKSSREQIIDSIDGNMTSAHRFLIQKSLKHIEQLEISILEIELEMDNLMNNHIEDLGLLRSVCGVGQTAARDILASIGPDISVFPSKHHIASWAGLCPGNNESAGKRYSGKIGHGDPNLKATLTECAWAAVRTKNTYFAAKFRQLAARRGSKRALIAIAHKILINCYHVLKSREKFRELGEDFLLSKKKDKLKKSYVQKLTNLGFDVQVSPRALQ